MNRILSLHNLMIVAVIVLAAISSGIILFAEHGWLLAIIIAIVTECYARFHPAHRETAVVARR